MNQPISNNRPTRLNSLDIFRGLTILVMVFVNDLAGVINIPGWMKHIPAGQNGMTFVDIVFPAFLFIVGMAIPFAVEARLSHNSSRYQLWYHVVLRALGLIILGIFMVNSEEINVDLSLIPAWLWSTGVYIAAIFIWTDFRKWKFSISSSVPSIVIRTIGIILLGVLYLTYRKGEVESPIGMTSSWFGILGLIGWAYLYAMILYMLGGRRLLRLSLISLGLLFLLLVLRSDLTHRYSLLDIFQSQKGHITHTLITLFGVVTSLLLRRDFDNKGYLKKTVSIVIFAFLLAVLGWQTLQFGGIAKIGATPSWALFSAAISCIVFAIIYWVVDVKKVKTWLEYLLPAGMNPLLFYILPFIFYALFGFSGWPEYLNSGFPGFFRSVFFTMGILWLGRWLTQKKIILKL